MPIVQHRTRTYGSIHRIANWNPADATARLALVVTSADVGKIAHQADNDGFYVLLDDSPMTWLKLFTATADLADGGITNAKLATRAQGKILARKTTGTGAVEDATLSELLDLIASTRGSLLYRGASGWAVRAPVAAGKLLTDNGVGADPSWEDAPAGGISALTGDVTASGTGSQPATLAKLAAQWATLTESLATGTAQPKSLADSVFSGYAAGGSAAGTQVAGLVAGSFASSGAETGTSSAQAGLGSTAASGYPYPVADFPGQQGIKVRLEKSDGDSILLINVLSTALTDLNTEVYGYLSYRSDLAADAKWRLWYYYRRSSDGVEVPITPDTSISNCRMLVAQVLALTSITPKGFLGAPQFGEFAAEIGPNSVTNSQLAKMATLTLKGNITGGSADAVDSTLSAIIDACLGSTRGAVLYRGASGWALRAPGTSGHFLKSFGSGADPDYALPTISGASLTAIYSLTPPPVVSNWTFVNQGTATKTDVADPETGILLEDLTGNASLNYRIIKQSIVSTPFNYDAAFKFNVTSANWVTAGFCIRQSSDGKFISFGIVQNSSVGAAWTIRIIKHSGVTDYGTLVNQYAPLPGLGIFLRYSDDGTNRTFYYSVDAQNWAYMYAEARTTYLTADEIGIQLVVNNTSAKGKLGLIHWLQT